MFCAGWVINWYMAVERGRRGEVEFMKRGTRWKVLRYGGYQELGGVGGLLGGVGGGRGVYPEGKYFAHTTSPASSHQI